MKIAMPISEKSVTTSVCPSFGRSPYFLIYDTESENHKFVKNDAVDSQGGAGIRAAQVIVDNDVDVLLTPRCGENAAAVLKAADIELYRTSMVGVTENIVAYEKGQLSPLNTISPGRHHHGGRR